MTKMNVTTIANIPNDPIFFYLLATKLNDFIPKKHYQKNKSLILTFSKSFKGFSEDFMLKFGTHNFLYF